MAENKNTQQVREITDKLEQGIHAPAKRIRNMSITEAINEL